MNATMPFVSIDWTLVIQLVNTGILFLLLKHFLFQPVKNMIDSRQAEVSEIYKDAENKKAEAERLQKEYAQSLSGAKEEANNIVRDASKRAQTRADEIVADAEHKAAAMMQKAENEIAQEKKKAINEVKDEISEIAVEIASKVVEKDIDSRDHEKLIQDFIDGAGDLTWKA